MVGSCTVDDQFDNETKFLTTVKKKKKTLLNFKYDFEDNCFGNILAVAEILHLKACQLLCRWGR